MGIMIEKMTVSPDEDGMRLDAVLARLFPGLGLRARRRMCENDLALVNGRPQKAAFKVRGGDAVSVAAVQPPAHAPEASGARLIRQSRGLAFLLKPSGMPSAALAGKGGACLEALLPTLLPKAPGARLLNRLDTPTSGIVVAALDSEGEEYYRAAQAAGRTEKRYLAVLQGALARTVQTRRAILQSDRRRVRVAAENDPDPLRRTLFEPLALLEGGQFPAAGAFQGELTLAGCTIFRGARHQIRAHAAALGFPLLGDRLYGGCALAQDPLFFLHHGALILPQERVHTAPPFALPEEALAIAMAWLKR